MKSMADGLAEGQGVWAMWYRLERQWGAIDSSWTAQYRNKVRGTRYKYIRNNILGRGIRLEVSTIFNDELKY